MADTTQLTTAAKDDAQGRAMAPAVDIFEDAQGITLIADMPGVPKDALDVRVDGDTLLIAGTVSSSTPEGLRPVWAELSVPRYQRTFGLSRELDTARIEATLRDGVLDVRIPKQQHAQPRRINVAAG